MITRESEKEAKRRILRFYAREDREEFIYEWYPETQAIDYRRIKRLLRQHHLAAVEGFWRTTCLGKAWLWFAP
jgi:hypothetical protein